MTCQNNHAKAMARNNPTNTVGLKPNTMWGASMLLANARTT